MNSVDQIDMRAQRPQHRPRGINVDGFSFENSRWSAAYNRAIAEKQAAQQQMETERQRLAQHEIFAQRKVATARGDTESQIERARDETEPNRLIGGSLTPAILQNRCVEKLSDGGGLILNLPNLNLTMTPPTPSAAP